MYNNRVRPEKGIIPDDEILIVIQCPLPLYRTIGILFVKDYILTYRRTIRKYDK
jgi:hypothetical protein